jgi:hypothetical protein
MLEEIVLVIFAIPTGSSYGYLITILLPQPIEQSRRLYHNSIFIFLLGLILAIPWYVLGFNSESHSSLCFGNIGSSILIAILSLFSSIKQRRKYLKLSGSAEIINDVEGKI